MNTHRTAVRVGLFTVASLVMILAMVIYFSGGTPFWQQAPIREATVIFKGSVKGLNVGAPVTLRGVKVGEVTQIAVKFDSSALEFFIPVELNLNLDELNIKAGEDGSFIDLLIQRGMRAQLKTQSLLTGLLYVDLDFLPDTEPRFMDYPTDSVQLPTAPSELEAILQSVSQLDIQSFMKHLDETVQHAGELLSDPELRRVPAELNKSLATMESLSANLDQRTALLSQRLDSLITNTDDTVTLSRQEINQISEQLNRTLAQAQQTLSGVQTVSDELRFGVSEQSPLLYELTRTLEALTRAARSLESLSNGLELRPESLIRGKSEDQ